MTHDNWKQQTPEDEQDEREKREALENARIERQIDGRRDLKTLNRQVPLHNKGIDRSHDFAYDPFNP